MSKKTIILFFALQSFISNAQTFQWVPTNSPMASFRFEDVYFLNIDTGFAVHYYSIPFGGDFGYILKTTDGGNTWLKVLDSTTFFFRDIGFTDSIHGWAGTIAHNNSGADTNIIYKTTDGGLTWSGVDNLPGSDSAGICGLKVINDSTIYGVGRYYGPSHFYKTNNNGQSWSYINLDSLVTGLVDIFFFDADTGFVIGTSGPTYNTGYGRVLSTTDGGNSWSIAYTSTHSSTLGWKIVFPSRNVGYCSLQCFNNCNSQTFLKTTDGGVTWQDIVYSGGPSNWYDVEGIGFLNDTVGWVGGNTNVFYTQNGGTTWTLQTWGNNLNRFRFLSDSIGYSAGQQIYKMHISATGIMEIENKDLLTSYPNPATDYAYFEFPLSKSMRAKLTVYDMNGNEVEQVFDEIFSAGNQHFMWLPKNLSKGVYFCVLTFGNNILRRKLEIIK